MDCFILHGNELSIHWLTTAEVLERLTFSWRPHGYLNANSEYFPKVHKVLKVDLPQISNQRETYR